MHIVEYCQKTSRREAVPVFTYFLVKKQATQQHVAGTYRSHGGNIHNRETKSRHIQTQENVVVSMG